MTPGWNQWRVVRALDIAPEMSLSPRALHRRVIAVFLPLLAAPLPVSGAKVHKVKPRASAPAPIKASSAIIALPLSPIVPKEQRLCSARTPTGLGYTMLRPGSGAKPTQGDVSLVNYIGYLTTTGAVFDQGMRSPLPVNGVIPGFSQGLQMLAKTGVARFCIPAAMGYGSQASGPIPANSDLVFQVELLDFKTAAQVESMNSPQAAEALAQGDAVPQP
jgi:FKBP-type peptidyl-prolyl cis-trans isomerase FkpA